MSIFPHSIVCIFIIPFLIDQIICVYVLKVIFLLPNAYKISNNAKLYCQRLAQKPNLKWKKSSVRFFLQNMI